MSLQTLASRRFLPLFLTQFFGALNDNFFKNAIVVMITFRGIQVAGLSPGMVVALCGGVFILPFFLFSGTAGQLADKLEKGFLIRLTKLSELVVMLLAATGFYLDDFHILLGALFLMGLQSTVFGPLKYGIIPELVDGSALVAANAYVESGTFVAILIGTIVGGLAMTFGESKLLVVACVVGVALLGLLASWFVPRVPVRSRDVKVDWTFVRSTFEIIAAVRPNRPIFNAILGISWFWFLGAAILTVLPTFAKDTLHAGEQVVTAFLTVFTIGIGVGSLVCEKLSFRRVEVGVIPYGAVGMSVFLVDLCIVGSAWSVPDGAIPNLQLAAFVAYPGGWRVLVDLLLVAFSGGMFIVPLYSFIQQRGEPAFLSRIIAANNIVNALFMVVASLLVIGLFGLGATIPQVLLVFAALNLAVSVYIYSVVPEFTLRFLSWILAHVMYRVRTVGAEHLPVEGPAVLVCNHVSFVDWLIIFGECKIPVRFVMDHRIFQTPLVGWLFRHGKVIPIAPAKEDAQTMEAAFAKVSAELRDEEVVGIFPEGALTRDGQMASFRPGIERIVQQDAVPVVPMALHGLWGSYFSRSAERGLWKALRRWRREIVLHVAPLMAPQQVTAAGLEAVVRDCLAQAEAGAGGAD